MKYLCIGFIRLYRRFISPWKPPCCRFTPSCSAYAIEAFSKRGFFAGMVLTVWRVLRCNPFCRGGYDPVPDRGFRRVKLNDNEKLCTSGAGSDTNEANNATDGAATPGTSDTIEAKDATDPQITHDHHKEKET